MTKDVITVHDSGTDPDQDIGLFDLDLRDRRKGYASARYHFVLRRDGTIEKGRDISSPSVADSLTDCRSAVSVCLVGGKGGGETGRCFTEAQLHRLSILLAELSIPTIRSKSKAYDQQIVAMNNGLCDHASPLHEVRV